MKPNQKQLVAMAPKPDRPTPTQSQLYPDIAKGADRKPRGTNVNSSKLCQSARREVGIPMHTEGYLVGDLPTTS